MRNDIEAYKITAEMNLKKIIAESREVAQAVNELDVVYEILIKENKR